MQDLRARKSEENRALGHSGVCALCGEVFRGDSKGLRVCGEGVCKRHPLGRTKLRPFTVKHFELWASFVVLDTDEPWEVQRFQRDFLADVFAGVPEVWLLIPEGNTKTTTLGGLGLYHCQFKRYAKVPVAAAAKEQAGEMYGQQQGMVERSEMLSAAFDTLDGIKEIRCLSQHSTMKVRAADDRTGDGAIFTLALIDELHRHKDLSLYRTWVGKRRKRGGQICGISTAGEPGSEFEETREQIRRGATKLDPRGRGYCRYESKSVVLHEFAVPQDGDVEDMRLVKEANPHRDITVPYLREKRSSLTMTLPHWKRLTCNVATRSVTSAITESEWFRQRVDMEIPEGQPIWAGLDVAWKWDTTALVPLWRWQESDARNELLPIHTRRKLQEMFGGGYPSDGEFMLLGVATILDTPQDQSMLDPDEIEEALEVLHRRNPIHTLVMDMSKAEQLAVWAQRNLGCEVVDRGQGNNMACLDYTRFMGGLREQTLWHVGDPGLTQHVLNAVAKTLPGGDTRFDRPRQARQVSDELRRRRVVDALTAACLAVTTATGEQDTQEYAAAGFR